MGFAPDFLEQLNRNKAAAAKPSLEETKQWLTENAVTWEIPTHKLGIGIGVDTPATLQVQLIGE